MNADFRTLTLAYTVLLAVGVSLAVGGAGYLISSSSLESAYERRFQAGSREAAQQMVDPVYRLDAFEVQRLRDLLREADPSLVESFVVDRDGRLLGDPSASRLSAPKPQLEATLANGAWRTSTAEDPWLFVGPVMDPTGRTLGAVALYYSPSELREALHRLRWAALATFLGVTLLACIIGYLLARRAIRPLDRIVLWVQEIGAHQFHQPAPESVQASPLKEVRRLAASVEEMAARLDRTTVSLEEAETARLEAERANRLKTSFLANMSHEIRTPLHAIVGHAELLRAALREEGHEERIEGIQIAVRSLLRLIEDILDLAKIESGNLELKTSPFNLKHLVREVIEITQVRTEPGQLELRSDLAPDLEVHRLGDADRIRQILINLVSNALKFTEKGEVVLQVLNEAGERVCFEVRDSGRGMPEDEIENLFQPFARLVVDSARVSGSGLGLAICRQLAEVMGGDLRIDSRVGEGTVATFEVDLVKDSEAEEEPSVAIDLTEISLGPQTFPDLRVLVVEDNPINQTVVSSMLELLGCEILLASDGAEGVAAWREHRPSLILMDCSMPVLDGFEATRQIRGEEATTGEEPSRIIALTAHARREDEEKCRQAGMDEVLTKPLTLDRLREALGRPSPASAAE